MRNSIAILVAVLISGCATAEKFNENMKLVVGQPIKKVIMAWGQPAGVTPVGSGSIYHFVRASNPSQSTTYNEFTRSIDTTTSQQYCKVNLMTDKEGFVDSYTFEGQMCVSE